MYRITGTASGSTARRSAREKCNSNIRAIEIVKSDGIQESDTQDALAAYCGWGDSDVRALAFNWQGEPLPPLAGLLTRDEIEGARKSTINAHYTDPSVARAIWTVAMRLLGSTAGSPAGETFVPAAPGATLKILEPSCGNGMFFGTCPDAVTDAQFVGVEMDPLTSQIAARLYPEVKVICSPFERAALPADYFDLIIGNVPFADVRVVDESLPRYLRQTLHDYFVCKSLTLTRPGGIVALITSTGTLDKKGGQVRRWLADRADLVGALRLPSDAFTEIAGTQVTTDVLFLQRRVGQGLGASREWTESTEHTAEVPAAWGNVEDLTAQLNAYYPAHPDMMLGTLCRDKLVGGRGDGRFGVKSRPDAGPLDAQMLAASKGFTASADRVDPPVGQPPTHTAPCPAVCPATDAALAIHRAVKTLLSAESGGAEDEIRRLRRRLNTAYDMYHRQWGRLSLAESQPEHPLAHLRSDRRWPLLLSLEAGQGHAAHSGHCAAHRQSNGHKAPIFTRRTLLSYVAPTDTSTPQDALYRCLDTSGAVDLLRIAELSQVTPEEAADALRGVIFRTSSGEWQTADRYLSGDVVGKLRDAHAAAELDPTYAENVAALERVQPERVPPEQIHATLGAPWIPPGTVEYFAYSLFPGQTWGLHIAYVEPTATWSVTCTNPRIERSEENRSVVGAPRMYGLEILQDTLNLKIPVIYDEFEGVDGGTYRVKNEQETAAAQGKQVELRERWAAWAWADAERADSLANLYNARYNTMRPRTFCGAHLTFPGLASEMGGKPLTLQKHQVDGAARILSCGSGGSGGDSGCDEGTLLTWKMGLGKTLGSICGAVKRVQLGLSRRALFVVPNHTLPDWRAAFLSAYPGLADELIASTDDAFGPANRKRFLSSIATGDARYALVTYEQFKSIPLSQETFQSHMEAEISDLRAHLDAAIAGSDEAKALKRAFKAREKTLLRFAARYEEAWARATATGDAPIMWDDLGVDLLVYDECHMVKNDMFSTHMTNIAGLPRAESHRAFDARVKAHVTMHRGGVLIGLTGTPITNTLAEAWIMMRLFQPGTLRRLGLQHFDAWAATFAEPYVSVEMDSVGKFRTQTRLKFQNIPELLNILAEAWDRAETEE